MSYVVGNIADNLQDLGVSRELVNLSITTYILAQGIGPSFWGPLADYQGRRITLMYTLTLFVGANIALALSTSGPMLLVFRALQALGSASTISLGSGIIADISPPSERGGYIGWFSGGESSIIVESIADTKQSDNCQWA